MGGMSASDLLPLAIDAVHAASLATESVRRASAAGAIAAITKGDASPVTVADFASQAVVMHILQSALGPIAMLGEESDRILRDPSHAAILEAVVEAAQQAVPILNADRVLSLLSHEPADPSRADCWTLDPVDGTKGFLRGGQYAIALAHIESGRPTLGALACPRLALDIDDPSLPSESGVLAFAVRGAGAHWMSLADPESERAERLVAPTWHEGDGIRLLLSVESAHGDADSASVIAARCGPLLPPLRLDSASKYALLAHGRGNGYMRVPRRASGAPERKECVWDHAAGVLIVEEAGCVTCDLDGRPLDFAAGPTLARNRGLIAAAPGLARRLVERMHG